MNAPQITTLPDGRRLHFHHGPIDLIVEATGPDRDTAHKSAAARFQTILSGLVAELPALRSPYSKSTVFRDATARRMQRAVSPFPGIFVTPMAAVAGAVADEVLAAMTDGLDLSKAYVNNGGDIAFHLGVGKRIRAVSPAGPIEIAFADPARGLATSGWRARSHSLGIADAVTVAARTAAAADAAATLIANAVDLPGHPSVTRAPACDLSPDSDLGDRLVTTDVGPLSGGDIATALESGEERARLFLDRGLISGAMLVLSGGTRLVTLTQKAMSHA